MEQYILVPFPEVQDYMEEDWFKKEAVLDVHDGAGAGSSSYFIPASRVDKDYIIENVKELCRAYKPTQKQLDHYKSERESALPYEGGIMIEEAIVMINQEITS